MMSVLRVASTNFDVDAFLRSHPQFEPDAIWHTGEVSAAKRRATTNGFNLFVAEHERWSDVLASSLDYCRLHCAYLEDARRAGGTAELDFAVEPGEGGFWAISARFSVDDLAMLTSAGITLCVTVYPPSRRKE
jgi:hypothetical protein